LEKVGHPLLVCLAVPCQAEAVPDRLLEPLGGADLDHDVCFLLSGVPPVVGRVCRHVYALVELRYRLATVDAEADPPALHREPLLDNRVDVLAGDGPAGLLAGSERTSENQI
jgi:hypothetical protein